MYSGTGAGAAHMAGAGATGAASTGAMYSATGAGAGPSAQLELSPQTQELVRCIPPLAQNLRSGASAMYFTTGAGVTVTAGTGAMYSNTSAS